MGRRHYSCGGYSEVVDAMIPCLYDSSETEYAHNGIGKLADCQSCLVTEKRNGSYELKMTYPMDGIHAEYLVEGNIILAKSSDSTQTQPFRIYKVTTPLSGKLTVQARHISYQLNYITVSPCSGDGPQDALNAILSNATTECPFTLQVDFSSAAAFKISVPVSMRSCLGGVDGSMIDTYGGELEWDRYTVTLHSSRGADHGVRIVYGKNLIDFSMEKSIENVITGIHPYWKNPETGSVVELSEKVVQLSDADSPFAKIVPYDFSEQFESEPTEDELRSAAESYLNSTSQTEPDMDITVDFIKLSDTPGYEDIAEAESVSLCDTVHVYISRLGIEVSSKVTETVYDSLLERYSSITLSNSLASSRNSSLSSSLSSIMADAQAATQAASQSTAAVSMASEQTLQAARELVESLFSDYTTTIANTYETKTDSAQGDTDAKAYADTAIGKLAETLSSTYQSQDGMGSLYEQWMKEVADTYATQAALNSIQQSLSSYLTSDAFSQWQLTLPDTYASTEAVNAIKESLTAYLTTESFNQWQETTAETYATQEALNGALNRITELENTIKTMTGGE
ncbi:MAG: phage tail protein [Lachnospiraceae bacterium]|nr:phage tail protein [Lachnospiraceae bacterium]